MNARSLMTPDAYAEYVKLKRRLEFLELQASYAYRNDAKWRKACDDAYADVLKPLA